MTTNKSGDPLVDLAAMWEPFGGAPSEEVFVGYRAVWSAGANAGPCGVANSNAEITQDTKCAPRSARSEPGDSTRVKVFSTVR